MLKPSIAMAAAAQEQAAARQRNKERRARRRKMARGVYALLQQERMTAADRCQRSRGAASGVQVRAVAHGGKQAERKSGGKTCAAMAEGVREGYDTQRHASAHTLRATAVR
jgi:hypothetical protein